MDRAAVVLAMLAAVAWLSTAVVPRPSDARDNEPRSFLGYACPDDCGPEKTGYGWAELHGVSDPQVCQAAGPSRMQGWIHGCRAYAEEIVSAEQAGERWATENELDSVSECDGAGPGFRAGCLCRLLLGGGAEDCAVEPLR